MGAMMVSDNSDDDLLTFEEESGADHADGQPVWRILIIDDEPSVHQATMLALKGFAAAMLGGMGNPLGAVAGGLILGLLEALGVGYISSTYKDAFAFIVILLVLFAMPQGLFGRRTVERV